MNVTVLVGRLAKNPELRYTQSGEPMAVCRFTVAVNRPFAKDGDIKADFINCVAFGKKGEVVNQYFHKGSRIGVEGRLQVSQYKDKDGNNRYSTDVIVNEIEFIDTKAESGAAGTGINNQAGQTTTNGFSISNADDDDEDLPF